MEGIFQLQWKQENKDEKSQGTRQHGEIFVGNKGTQTPPPPPLPQTFHYITENSHIIKVKQLHTLLLE